MYDELKDEFLLDDPEVEGADVPDEEESDDETEEAPADDETI